MFFFFCFLNFFFMTVLFCLLSFSLPRMDEKNTFKLMKILKLNNVFLCGCCFPLWKGLSSPILHLKNFGVKFDWIWHNEVYDENINDGEERQQTKHRDVRTFTFESFKYISNLESSTPSYMVYSETDRFWFDFEEWFPTGPNKILYIHCTNIFSICILIIMLIILDYWLYTEFF